jgi:alkylation response protein AidB-like acyl-CoA dehydrogenase
VDFRLSDDEVALADSVRSFCAARIPLEQLRIAAGSEAPGAFDRAVWASLAETGVFSLQVPASQGGVGLGMGAASVVFEELGRALVPGPLVSSHLAARDLPDLGERASSGALVVGAVRRPDPKSPDALCPVLVPHLSSLDVLVVVGQDRLSLVEPSDLGDARPLERSLDPLTPIWALEELPEGADAGEATSAARWRRDEETLTAAVLVGLADKCVEMAVSYSKEREQFGRPIGSFQAVKHMCADMLVRAEVARVAVQAAAVTADQPDVGDAERAAAGATLLAAEAAIQNAKTCIQVYGGMGFTWEVPVHLFLVRARMLAESLSSPSDLADLVAERY